MTSSDNRANRIHFLYELQGRRDIFPGSQITSWSNLFRKESENGSFSSENEQSTDTDGQKKEGAPFGLLIVDPQKTLLRS